jgi:NADPH:quinone reductase-like Zn-dependent oxidoreductase
MKAIAITGHGTQPTLQDNLPSPDPAPGEVLVRVRASSLNGFDLAVVNGYLQGVMEHRFPVVLGKDFAGTVEGTGAGVDGFAPGEAVFGVVMKPYLGDGGLGELVTTPSMFVAKGPAGVELATAGALGRRRRYCNRPGPDRTGCRRHRRRRCHRRPVAKGGRCARHRHRLK